MKKNLKQVSNIRYRSRHEKDLGKFYDIIVPLHI
jgi:hypothetical protein